jgi:hypothetical protein
LFDPDGPPRETATIAEPARAARRLLAFGLLPFAAGYTGVALAMRRRRRRVMRAP